MSTFKGVIDEFPDIRVDFFRLRPGMPLPLACFLSHIHSDHLEGLESYKSPFIYCSPATKELLVLLERKISRVMHANGTSEGARNRRYKDLAKVLRPIPLETPTKIELVPGNEIQVTLFDANHCTGAVMFLFEGNGKAVLYTGDIRSEPWWVNSLARNPFMIEYSAGLKSLDCIYLDTSNTKRMDFPTKAEGLKELLEKVSDYPSDTIFHLSSWTFGYEEVWMALSKALGSPIHVDSYKYRLYESLCGNVTRSNQALPRQGESSRDTPMSGKYNAPAIAYEGPTLVGYKCGNTFMPGCLTKDDTVRLHSCEKGMCRIIDDNDDNIVWIRPIVTRTKAGAELAEVGIGGGGEDLTRNLEVELDDDVDVKETLKKLEATGDPDLKEVGDILAAGFRSGTKRLFLNGTGMNVGEDSLTLSDVVEILAQSVRERRVAGDVNSAESQNSANQLPRSITFPYSRHSSYPELCDLVKTFRPRDVYPCTVDEQHWDDSNISIGILFGRFCSSKDFRHEREMNEWRAARVQISTQQTHTTTTDSQPSQVFFNSHEQTRAFQSDVLPERMLRRNSLGRLRLLDQGGNEVISEPTIRSNSPGQLALPNPEHNEMQTADKATPTRRIHAVSPNSESQGLRRKAIHEQLGTEEVKRVRLDYDGARSSPTTRAEESSLPAPVHEVIEVDSESNFDEDRPRDTLDINVENTRIYNFGGPHPGDYDSDYGNPSSGHSHGRMWDAGDEIWRCKQCGHELWGGRKGHCTGPCDNVPNRFAYSEVLDPEAPPLPDIAVDEDTDEFLEGKGLKSVVGPCLDYDSSAYDSADSNGKFREEYDYEDSFIDDHISNNGSSSEDDGPSEVEPDYEVMFNQLQERHNDLIGDFIQMDDAFRDLRRDIGIYSSDSEDDDNDELDDEMDEDGVFVVDVKVPNPTMTEIVVSHAQGETQESEVTEERIKARAIAFEAAQESSWDEISSSMMTTGNNHTLPEIEL